MISKSGQMYKLVSKIERLKLHVPKVS